MGGDGLLLEWQVAMGPRCRLEPRTSFHRKKIIGKGLHINGQISSIDLMDVSSAIWGILKNAWALIMVHKQLAF